jgi:predicted phage terminase large subunit-like protein
MQQSPVAGNAALGRARAQDQKEELVYRWQHNKSLFMKQVLNYPLMPFQIAMLKHKGAKHMGRNISMRLLPRDSGKSWGGTIGDAIFETCMNPNLRGQIIAEALETAVMFLGEVKAQLDGNDKLKYFFGEHTGRTWAQKRIVSKQRTKIFKEPTLEALGAGGATVGRHVDIQWMDDVVSERTSSTTDKQDKLAQWYDKTATPVLEQGGDQRINGTRWYPTDLYNYLLDKYGTDILFKLPALTEIGVREYNDERARMGDCMPVKFVNGRVDHSDQILQSYFPERYPPIILHELRRSNPVTFASQYQNDISLLNSAFIKPEAIKIISSSEWPDFRTLNFFIGVDPATGTKKGTDYFSSCTVAHSEQTGKIYIFRSTRLKLSDSSEMLDHILGEWRWVYENSGTVVDIAIESNAFQSVIAHAAYNDPEKYGLLPISEIFNLKDKVQRLISIAHYFNLDKVLFDEDCDPLITELLQFPNVAHDDRVDAMMNAFQALNTTGFAGLSLPMNIYDLQKANSIVLSF